MSGAEAQIDVKSKVSKGSYSVLQSPGDPLVPLHLMMLGPCNEPLIQKFPPAGGHLKPLATGLPIKITGQQHKSRKLIKVCDLEAVLMSELGVFGHSRK